MAAAICKTPVFVMTLVGRVRLYFKSRVEVLYDSMRRSGSLCDTVVKDQMPLTVPSAREDPRFLEMPKVAVEGSIQFYAGIPLKTPEGLT